MGFEKIEVKRIDFWVQSGVTVSFGSSEYHHVGAMQGLQMCVNDFIYRRRAIAVVGFY